MRMWAVACYVTATVAEVGGFGFIVWEVWDSRRTFRKWMQANPNKNEDGSWDQVKLINKVVRGLLGRTWPRVTAAVLVVVGIGAGAAGNFLSLPSA